MTANIKKHPGLVGTGLLGAGVGSYALSNKLLSPDDYGKLQDFSKVQDTWKNGANPRQALNDYATYGHEAMNAKIMGINAVDAMKMFRSPLIMNHVPGLSSWAWGPKSGDHYQQFQKSPLDAYLQYNKEFADKPQVYEQAQDTYSAFQQMFSNPTADLKSRFLRETGLTENPINTPNAPANMGNAFDTVNKDVQTSPNFKLPDLHNEYLDKLKQYTQSFADNNHVDLAHATADEKNKIYGGLDPYIKNLNPDFWKQKQYTDYSLGTEVPDAGNIYNKMLVKPLLNTHDALKWGGIGAGVAGAGLAGYGAYRMIRNHLDKKKLQQKTV